MQDQPVVVARTLARRRIVDRRAQVIAGGVTLLGLLFVGLALALRGAKETGFDLAVTHTVQWIDAPAFTYAMLAVSAPGYAPWSWLVLGSAVVLLLAGRFYREVPFVVATEGAGMLVASIKLLVERPRPADESIRVFSAVLDYSFPSGHVVGYTCLYGFLAFLVYVLFKRCWWRTALLAVFALLIGFVGISRIHLGHHWASDVLGGYALGTAYLLVLVEAYRLLVILPRTPTKPSPEPAPAGHQATRPEVAAPV